MLLVITVVMGLFVLSNRRNELPRLFPNGTVAPTCVVVPVSLARDDPTAMVDGLLVSLEKAIEGTPGIHCLSFASRQSQAVLIAQFESGKDTDAAVREVQERIDNAKDRIPKDTEDFGALVMKVIPGAATYVNVSSAVEGHDHDFLHNYAQTTLLPAFELNPRLGMPLMVGDRRIVARVHIDVVKMHQSNVVEKDIITVLQGAGLMSMGEDQIKAAWRGPGVIELCCHHLSRETKVEDLENAVLRSNADGEAVRLKDFAQVQIVPLYPSYHDRNTSSGSKTSAAIVLLKPHAAKVGVQLDRVNNELVEIRKKSPAPDIKIEAGYQSPEGSCLTAGANR